MKSRIFTFALTSLLYFVTMPTANAQESEPHSNNQEVTVERSQSSLEDGLDMTDFYEKWS